MFILANLKYHVTMARNRDIREEMEGLVLLVTGSFTASNLFFQTMELLAFFGGTKELGEPTGWEAYDEAKMLVEAYNMQSFFMGVGQWRNEKALEKLLDSAGNKAEGGSGLGEGNETLKRKDIKNLLNSGKTPDDLLKAGYSVDDLLKAGVTPDDLPGYQHLVTGEGLVRKKAQVVGGHNIDSFYEAIKQDAQNLGLDISDCNIKITEHPTIKGLYQIEYSIPRVNGNTNPLTPLYDNTGKLLTKPADDFKTVYNTTEIGFSDIEIYAMGKQALEAEILAGNVSGYTVQATINGITFKEYYRNGVLTNFFPIFE